MGLNAPVETWTVTCDHVEQWEDTGISCCERVSAGSQGAAVIAAMEAGWTFGEYKGDPDTGLAWCPDHRPWWADEEVK